MSTPRLTKPELQIMEALWNGGPLCIRDILDTLPARKRPMYSTVQTVVYRLEAKGVLRRTRKIGNAHIFEATISRESAKGRLIDEILSLFGGRAQPMMTHLVETGKITLSDVQEAEALLRKLAQRNSSKEKDETK